MGNYTHHRETYSTMSSTDQIFVSNEEDDSHELIFWIAMTILVLLIVLLITYIFCLAHILARGERRPIHNQQEYDQV
jgi:heme/copper-type cytochrome/quinol oxidase subunit 2